MSNPLKSLPGTVQEVRIPDVKKCFPPRCKFTTTMSKNQAGERYPVIMVECTPAMGEKEYDYCKQSVFEFLPCEMYTKTEGQYLNIYPKTDKKLPFTFIF